MPGKKGNKRQSNPYACHPMLKKGGCHEKSKGAKRAAAKRETRQTAKEWLGPSCIYGLCFFVWRVLRVRR